MVTRDEAWPDGTPAWVDLMVPDRFAARDFYGSLFGWEFDEGDPETGYYATCLSGGRPAAGRGEAPPGGEGPPPVWTTYLAASDADAAVACIREAGGAVMMEPMTVMDFGRMAVVADPTGAVFGLWQAGEHNGAEIASEPGAVTWNECLTRDFPTAKAFYTKAFGYGTQDLSAEGITYNAIEVDGQTVGGLGDMGGMWPAEVPPHWLTYFAVADTDAATARATELGGTVQRPGRDGGFGRITVLRGPNGETFAVIGPNTETADATSDTAAREASA